MTKHSWNWLGFKTENEMINDAGTQFYDEKYKIPFTPGELTHYAQHSYNGETDPRGVPLNTPGAKADAGKIKPWLMLAGFSRALELVSEVTTKGAEKYTPNGWAEVPDGIDRYMEGFSRHLLKLGKGEIYDNGPNGIGTKHKAQMIWNLLASLELEERGKSTSET